MVNVELTLAGQRRGYVAGLVQSCFLMAKWWKSPSVQAMGTSSDLACATIRPSNNGGAYALDVVLGKMHGAAGHRLRVETDDGELRRGNANLYAIGGPAGAVMHSAQDFSQRDRRER